MGDRNSYACCGLLNYGITAVQESVSVPLLWKDPVPPPSLIHPAPLLFIPSRCMFSGFLGKPLNNDGVYQHMIMTIYTVQI